MAQLSEAQIDHFIEHGYIKLNQAFSTQIARQWVDEAWGRIGYNPDDRSTWAEAKPKSSETHRVEVEDFAPRVWEAACELLGGEERVKRPYVWADAFIVNLSFGADRPWQPASDGPAVGGWHKDGDFFLHFLDSPEQGLLTLVLWSDVEHKAGPTYVAADSVGPVARYLADHPEGVLPGQWPAKSLVGECENFIEATGRAADVYLMHPFVLHAASQNVRQVPRFITNPPIKLKEPMRFDRPDPSDHSPVERAVLRGLGKDRYTFTATSERRKITPKRFLKAQAKQSK